MLLTDLNIDCLEAILELLELDDLIQVADSNKRLQHASKFVFIRKYGRLEMQSRIRSDPVKICIETTKKHMTVYKLKSRLQLLRNFGSLISQILLESICLTTPVYVDYINEFCSDSLTGIGVSMYDEDVLHILKKPFTKVKTVHLTTYFIRQENSLGRLFPNMQTLKLSYIRADYLHTAFFSNHFPCLEYFELNPIRYTGDSWSYKDDDPLKAEAIKGLLRLNPQLKRLCMKGRNQSDADILQVFHEQETSLEYLELIGFEDFFEYFNEEKFHLTNVKHLSILTHVASPYSFAHGIPFVCNQLETLDLRPSDIFRTKHMLDFCQNSQSLRKLRLYSASMVKIPRLAQSLPLLEELKCVGTFFTADEAIQILSLFKLLTLFDFNSFEHSNYRQLQSHLLNRWSIQFITGRYANSIILKRLV